MDKPNKERAKRIIVEIIRQAGGQITRKTALFKAFYFAHLFYAESEPGYLSDWPIVRMPHGPGIESANELIKELTDNGFIRTDHTPIGPYKAITFRTTQKELSEPELHSAEVAAIRRAVNLVKNMSAAELTDLTHEFSRSWNEAKHGERMDIYVDSIPEDEFDNREQELAELEEAWKSAQSAQAHEQASSQV